MQSARGVASDRAGRTGPWRPLAPTALFAVRRTAALAVALLLSTAPAARGAATADAPSPAASSTTAAAATPVLLPSLPAAKLPVTAAPGAAPRPPTPAGLLPAVPTGTVPGAPTGMLPGAPTGMLPGPPTGMLPGAPTGTPPGASTGVVPVAPTDTTVVRPPPAAAAPSADAGAPTGTAQRIYERTRGQLLQVRTLLKTQDSQSSVGSGFLVDAAGHLVTNYHVVSQYALQPDRHRLVYTSVDGRQGALELLAFDVVNDLALLRPAEAGALAGRGAVTLRPADEPLPRGARLYALGNPLDVGFAVAEGSYNGPAERSYLSTLFFGGSLSAGMSGGPALDDQGRLAGVNVAARRDGEQVSFLVPAAAVRALLARGLAGAPITAPAWPEIARQLGAHETTLTQRFVAQPWRDAGHPRWRIPVPQESWMRCWGRGSGPAVKGLQFERSDCEMDSRLFVGPRMLTGFITVRHEAYDGAQLGRWRFANRYSDSFGNEFIGTDDPQRTAAQCDERTVRASAQAPALRAVVCLRAYKKLDGLFDLTVLVATLGHATAGVQGRLDAQGVGTASARRLAQHYLDGFGWKTPPPAAAP